MKRVIAAALTAAAVVGAVTIGAQAPKPLASGIDTSTFDKTVRPQDDFFRYVNGGWLAKTPIPADKASYGSFDVLFDKSQVDLRAIIEQAAKAPGAAGLREPEDRRLLHELHGRGPGRGARQQAAGRAVHGHRRGDHEGRPRAPLRPPLEDRHQHTDGELRRAGLQGPERSTRSSCTRAASACPTATTT